MGGDGSTPGSLILVSFSLKPCLVGLHCAAAAVGKTLGRKALQHLWWTPLQPVGLCKASVTDGGVWARQGSALPGGRALSMGTCGQQQRWGQWGWGVNQVITEA